MEVEKRERAAAELSDFPGWPRVGSDGHWAVGIPAFTSGATTGLASILLTHKLFSANVLIA